MTIFQRYPTILFFLFLASECDIDGGIKIVTTDPGRNVTFTWRAGYERARYVEKIEIRFSANDTVTDVFTCSNLHNCYHRSNNGNSHIRVVTEPSFDHSSWPDYRIYRIGFAISNVNHSDAGMFTFRVVGKWQMASSALLYVYKKPTRPVIVGTVRDNETIISCTSLPKSLPREYRNNSDLQYTWTINSTLDNYSINNGIITVNSQVKTEYSTLFSCLARERNSVLVSEESERFFLAQPVLDNIQLSIFLFPDAPTKVGLSCAADCDPKCTYSWFDPEGKLVSHGQNITIGNRDQVPEALSCRAANIVGILTQRTKVFMISGRSSPEYTVISLSVFLVLAIGVIVVGGATFLLYKRRRQQQKTSTQNDTNISDVKEDRRQTFYKNEIFQSEDPGTASITYNQLDSSRDTTPMPSFYEIISVTGEKQESYKSDDDTYEKV